MLLYVVFQGTVKRPIWGIGWRTCCVLMVQRPLSKEQGKFNFSCHEQFTQQIIWLLIFMLFQTSRLFFLSIIIINLIQCYSLIIFPTSELLWTDHWSQLILRTESVQWVWMNHSDKDSRTGLIDSLKRKKKGMIHSQNENHYFFHELS